MAAKGEVDLIIRAKNEATKNLDAINKALSGLADQQKIVGDSAANTDDKLAQLSLELQKLQTNAKNLSALTTVGEVLDKATSAMLRQRQAAEEAATELNQVTQRQQALAAEGQKLGASLKTSTAELERQQKALAASKTSTTALVRETGSLGTQEKSLQSSLTSTQSALATRQAAFDKAVAKQAQLTQEIDASEKVTKRQQNSLDAANRALERRRAAVEATTAKEADLRAQLVQVQAAMQANAAAVEKANAALAEQAARAQQAKDAALALKTQTDSIARSEREVAKEVRNATTAVERQSSALDEAQKEYSQVQSAADAARAAVAGSAKQTVDAGNASARAAVQVATFAARLAVLTGAGRGRTSSPVTVDPAQIRAAEGALAQMGVTIRAADNATASASVSAKELTAALKGVSTAKNDIQGIGTAITTQQNAVNGAQAAWKTAEAEVRRLALAIKAADQPSTELAAAFGRAQGAARLAKTEFQQQGAAASKMANDLQQAGVGTGTLQSAQSALAPILQRANALMGQGQSAASRMGGAVRSAGNDAAAAQPSINRLGIAIQGLANGAGRLGSATNPLRAFKNELFAMVAASAGLYAIKEQLESIWQAGTDLAANESKFATAFGTIEEGNRQLAYTRQVALNLKLPLGTLTKNYADLALAAKGSKLEGEGARMVFEAFAQTARVNQTSAADLDGVFKALTQIMSKGKVQAEELRQQLGDRLPGAMQLMAQGLGITTAELDKMMEQGQLTSEALLNMASEVSNRVAPQLATALDSPAAKLQNFQNRILLLKEQIAESGFLDAMADALERIAQALSTPEAADGARKIGEALADLINWLVGAIDHIDTIILAIQGLAGAWVALQIGSMVSGVMAFATALGKGAAALGLVTTAARPLLVGLGLVSGVVAAVAAAFAAWKLVEWVYENVPAFAEGMLKIKYAALRSWDGILQLWEMTGVKLKSSFTRITGQLADIWYGMLNKILNSFPELTASLGLGDYAAEIARRAADAAAQVASNEAGMNAELDAIRAEYADKERDRQKELQDDILGYYEGRVARERADGTGSGGPSSRGRGAGGASAPAASTVGLGTVNAPGFDVSAANAAAAQAKADKVAARERLTLEKSVADQMYTIRSQLEKKSADDLESQLAAVPAKYAKLYDQLRTLGKDRNSQEWQTVDALVAQEQANLRSAAAKKESVAAAKAERDATTAENKSRKEAMEQVNTLMQTRKNILEQIARAEQSGDTDQAATLKENLATITLQAQDAINGMLAFWGAVGGPQADAAIAKLQTMQLELTKTRANAILTGQGIAKAFGEGLGRAASSFVDKLAETGDVIGSLKDAFREFAIDFLKRIATMIIQQIIFNALNAMSGGTAGFAMTAANAINASSNHTGGVVGRDSGPKRSLPAGLFANAVRYHGGGVAGLKSNEVATVLEEGEVVRTAQQERALADKQAAMAAAASGGGASPAQIKIVNQIDSGEMVAEGLGSAAGERAFINNIGKNRDQIKRLLA